MLTIQKTTTGTIVSLKNKRKRTEFEEGEEVGEEDEEGGEVEELSAVTKQNRKKKSSRERRLSMRLTLVCARLCAFSMPLNSDSNSSNSNSSSSNSKNRVRVSKSAAVCQNSIRWREMERIALRRRFCCSGWRCVCRHKSMRVVIESSFCVCWKSAGIRSVAAQCCRFTSTPIAPPIDHVTLIYGKNYSNNCVPVDGLCQK